MNKLYLILRRHWRKLLVLLLLIAIGVAYAVSPMVRDRSHRAWQAAVAWAGFGAEGVDSGADQEQQGECRLPNLQYGVG